MTAVYRRYAEKNIRGERLELVGQINAICDEYEARGYVLTVRQVYYQLVSRDVIGNSGRDYDRVQGVVNDGRMAGLISWTAIEDRGRQVMGLETRDSPAEAFAAARRAYRRDLWQFQPVRPEVWVEKQALEGVVERICSRLRVDFYATKGYDSQSQSWRAGRRFARRVQKGQRTVVVHLGDHDPSGIDMTRDNHERLTMFAGFPVPVERVALNMDQVERYRLPNNPDNRPKVGDSRTAAYVDRYGDQGWELDALDPDVISRIIEDKVLALRDEALWSVALAEETADRREMDDAIAAMGGGADAEESEDE